MDTHFETLNRLTVLSAVLCCAVVKNLPDYDGGWGHPRHTDARFPQATEVSPEVSAGRTKALPDTHAYGVDWTASTLADESS